MVRRMEIVSRVPRAVQIPWGTNGSMYKKALRHRMLIIDEDLNEWTILCGEVSSPGGIPC